MSKFVALDLETTGNDPKKDEILQIAAIVFESTDLDTPVERLPSFQTLVKRDRYFGDPFALHMNAWIFKRLANGEGQTEWDAFDSLSKFLDQNNVELAQLIGFNNMSFDLEFIKEAEPAHEPIPYKWDGTSEYTFTVTTGTVQRPLDMKRFNTTREPEQFFSSRGISLGTLFATLEGPSSGRELLRKYLDKEVSHDALEDCRDAVRLWRVWASKQ